MRSCAADHISSTSEDAAGPGPSYPLPCVLPEDQEVLQQLEHIRLNDDVDEQPSSQWHLVQKNDIMDHSSSRQPRNMPFHLLEEITDGFSDERKLGRGAFGKVYLGVHKDGEKIAVKVLYDMPGLEDDKFLDEFNNLARLHHPNIVRLVGKCYDIQKECFEYKGRLVLAERIRRALCFEYMHNGSLDKYISDDGLGLSWKKCYTLIKGICKGLKYLHEEASLYHLDLKPANILLDENMLPKIADFGLSRLFGEEKTWITKSFVGTCGYLPPEYIERNIISSKSDIFSLGVVIIKLMTGRTGNSRSSEMSPQEFVDFALENWRVRLDKTPKHLYTSYSEQVKKCMEIALSCVEGNQRKRPNIGDIVKQLDAIETETDYQIIGEGTFSKFRLAKNIMTTELVAVKIIHINEVLKHTTPEQVMQEILAMKRIKHPNVLRIYEVMASKTRIYIVLELATGGNLFDITINEGRMMEDEARRHFQQLIDVVDYCHSRGVYHRNLKPQKLLLDSYGNMKLSGFGLSTLSQHVKADGLLHTICGTPKYIAPEVLQNRGYDGAMADLWSCGVILFFLLAGYPPFEDSNLIMLYRKIFYAEFTFPPWMSLPAKRLLTRILDPNPMKRITIPQILEHEWFREENDAITIPQILEHEWFRKENDATLDDVDAVFNVSEENHLMDKEPVAMNAFDVISMSEGLNLGNIFDPEEFKGDTRFILQCPPKEIVRKIEQASIPLGFDVRKKNYNLWLKKVKAWGKGNLSVVIEILQVAPSLYMVESRKEEGDTLEFHEFYKNLSKTLNDVVWKSNDLQTQHAS